MKFSNGKIFPIRNIELCAGRKIRGKGEEREKQRRGGRRKEYLKISILNTWAFMFIGK